MIKHRTLLTLILACLAAFPGKAQDEFDVYLLLGQSNMAGRGEILPEDRAPMDGVFLLDGEGKPVPATVPFNIYSTVRKGKRLQGYNPGVTFGATLHEKTGRNILLVSNARGETSIQDWQKDAPQKNFEKKYGDDTEKWGKPMPSLFGEAVRRTRQAMQYGPLKGILWLQGEADSYKETAVHYRADLKRFVGDLRDSLGVGKEVPFVAGQVLQDFKRADVINAEIALVGASIPGAYCVPSVGCPGKSDQTHYTREGQRTMGERFAKLILKKVYKIKK